MSRAAFAASAASNASAALAASAASGIPRATLVAASLLACVLATSNAGKAGADESAAKVAETTTSLTVAGTAVRTDLITPVPGVRVAVMPESTVTFTDADGDFLLPWNGRDGWLTVISDEPARDGGRWCKRVVLRGITGRPRTPVVDLGPIIVAPRAEPGYVQVPIMPRDRDRPASLHVAGPGPGEPDTCRVFLRYAADLWGRTTRVGVAGGDSPPAGLRTALFAWIQGIPWIVANETACGTREPFEAEKWMDYAWADTAWVLVPPPRSRTPAGFPGGDTRDR